MKLTLSCLIFLLPCITGRRPRVVRPVLHQYQKYRPSVGSYLRHDNKELKWTRPPKLVKTGLFGDRSQITDYRLQDNRWNQYFAKQFPRFPSKKFVGPKKVFGRQRIKMVPVTDLRPHSIDKIDIYKPEIENIDILEKEENYRTQEISNNDIAPDNVNIGNNLQGNINLFEPNLQFGGVKVKPVGKVLTGERPEKQEQTNPHNVGGIQIYMFKGEEGLGIYDEENNNKITQDKIKQININNNIREYNPFSNQHPVTMFIGEEGLGVFDIQNNNNIIKTKVEKININDNKRKLNYININNPINFSSNVNNPINSPSNINNSPVRRWSQSEVTKRPTVTKGTINNNNNKNITSRDIRPAPFPTRHTTRAPDKDKEPIIIIGQSVVESNVVQTTTWSPSQLYQT